MAYPRIAACAVSLALSAVFTGLALTIYSLGISHVNDRLEPAQMVAASSALLRLNGAGAILGPVLVTGLMGVSGPWAYFATLATLSGAAGTGVSVAKEPKRVGAAGPQRPVHPRAAATLCVGQQAAHGSSRAQSLPSMDVLILE